jgi:hypothetical protein
VSGSIPKLRLHKACELLAENGHVRLGGIAYRCDFPVVCYPAVAAAFGLTAKAGDTSVVSLK